LNWITPQTLRGSFSAVSTPIFASKYFLESIFRDLQDLHTFAPLRRQKFNWKNSIICEIEYSILSIQSKLKNIEKLEKTFFQIQKSIKNLNKAYNKKLYFKLLQVFEKSKTLKSCVSSIGSQTIRFCKTSYLTSTKPDKGKSFLKGKPEKP
jgi:hypothetical protein